MFHFYRTFVYTTLTLFVLCTSLIVQSADVFPDHLLVATHDRTGGTPDVVVDGFVAPAWDEKLHTVYLDGFYDGFNLFVWSGSDSTDYFILQWEGDCVNTTVCNNVTVSLSGQDVSAGGNTSVSVTVPCNAARIAGVTDVVLTLYLTHPATSTQYPPIHIALLRQCFATSDTGGSGCSGFCAGTHADQSTADVVDDGVVEISFLPSNPVEPISESDPVPLYLWRCTDAQPNIPSAFTVSTLHAQFLHTAFSGSDECTPCETTAVVQQQDNFYSWSVNNCGGFTSDAVVTTAVQVQSCAPLQLGALVRSNGHDCFGLTVVSGGGHTIVSDGGLVRSEWVQDPLYSNQTFGIYLDTSALSYGVTYQVRQPTLDCSVSKSSDPKITQCSDAAAYTFSPPSTSTTTFTPSLSSAAPTPLPLVLHCFQPATLRFTLRFSPAFCYRCRSVAIPFYQQCGGTPSTLQATLELNEQQQITVVDAGQTVGQPVSIPAYYTSLTLSTTLLNRMPAELSVGGWVVQSVSPADAVSTLQLQSVGTADAQSVDLLHWKCAKAEPVLIELALNLTASSLWSAPAPLSVQLLCNDFTEQQLCITTAPLTSNETQPIVSASSPYCNVVAAGAVALPWTGTRSLLPCTNSTDWYFTILVVEGQLPFSSVTVAGVSTHNSTTRICSPELHWWYQSGDATQSHPTATGAVAVLNGTQQAVVQIKSNDCVCTDTQYEVSVVFDDAQQQQQQTQVYPSIRYSFMAYSHAAVPARLATLAPSAVSILLFLLLRFLRFLTSSS